MRIKFKKTPEQVELLKATVQKNEVKAREAQWAFAELMQPVLDQIILQADTTSRWFERVTFNEDDDPSFPIDAFNEYRDNTLSIWSQEVAGGLPTNHVTAATKEVKFVTYRLDSAISWEKKFSRKARLDIIGGYLTMLGQELLLKIRNNAWATIFTALANASHTLNGTATKHVFRATTADTFDMDELNYWFTLVRRLGQSWAAGTAEGSAGYGLTDLYVSPEFVQKIRKLSYNPINTLGANNVAGTAASGVIALSEEARRTLFNTAGVANFMGVNLNELQELGQGSYPFNSLFDAAAGATTYANRAAASAAAFDATNEEIVIGINAGAPQWGFRPIEVTGQDDPAVGDGDTFSLIPDESFLSRGGKTGFYAAIQLGHLITSDRGMSGFII